MEQVHIVRLAVVGVLSFLLLWLGLNDGGVRFNHTCSTCLYVTFLDVGQGDAILIETPDGVEALIDGGPDNTVLKELSTVLPWGDTTLDLVVGTHPDKDHIGGLIDVLKKYSVSTILTTENRGETNTATAYYEALTQETDRVNMARAGQVYALGASTTLTVYSPACDPSMLESNTSSIVLKLSFGDSDFMLTGDAPQSIEDYLATTYGNEIQSEVLKLGHHGSRTSTSDLFLASVKPTYAVVSAGAENSYGHPHEEVVNKVQAAGINLVNTADTGRITFVSDGQKVWIE